MLPLCHKSDAERVITATLKRQERRGMRMRIANWWESAKFALAWFVAGAVAVCLFFGAIALTSDADRPAAKRVIRT